MYRRSPHVFTAVFVAIALGCTHTPAPRDGTASAGATAPDDSARIARVFGGLLPTVEASGRAPARWTLAERMAFHHVPGVSIAVIEGGRIAWARGVGVKEAGKDESVTPTTLFQAASISKPVSATAMLRLVDRGTLDLDADVNRYLTSWKVPENAFTATEKVTLRRIASHTAGLTVHGFPGYVPGTTLPTAVQLLDGAAPANTPPVRVDVTPGSISRYSGGGTVVMQQLLEDVTKRRFPDLLRELVLEPVGMTRSTYEQPLPAARATEAARAHDHRGQVLAGGWHVYPEMAPAGLWTTPSDLLRWALAISDARAAKPKSILSAATTAQMLTAQKDGIGIGPFVGGSGRAFHFGHGGDNAGFHSELVMYPELGVGAAVMVNGDDGPPLIHEILRALSAEYGWPDQKPMRVTVASLTPEAMAKIAGSYTLQMGPGMPVEIFVSGERLMLRGPLPAPEELLPASDSNFVMATLGWRLTLARDASGSITGFRVDSDNGPQVTAVRVR